MKELSTEEKAKAYDEALKVLHKYDGANIMFSQSLKEEMFPELAESEGERIRQALIHFIKQSEIKGTIRTYLGVTEKEILAWLEKQDVQKSFARYKVGDTIYYNSFGRLVSFTIADIVEDGTDNPMYEDKNGNSVFQNEIVEQNHAKFKVGDWVIDKQGIVHQIANVIENVTYHTYGYDIVGGGYFNDNTEGVRLWTVQDAKNGDVLANDHHILILKELGYTWASNGKPECLYAYCGIKPDGNFELEKEHYCFCGILHTHPATKEQRYFLFQKMKEAGYEWDAEKLELKKVEQKHVFDVEIPFGTDSELVEETITIPDGCYAIIEDNKVILRKGEQKPAWSE